MNFDSRTEATFEIEKMERQQRLADWAKACAVLSSTWSSENAPDCIWQAFEYFWDRAAKLTTSVDFYNRIAAALEEG